MLSGAKYCPFRADIWQLGMMFKSMFGVRAINPWFVFAIHLASQHLGHLSQSLMEVFDAMCSEDPDSRPVAYDALEHVRQILLSCQTLSREVPEPPDVDSEGGGTAEHAELLSNPTTF
jgi:serine/threonine protein kinase